MIVGIAFGNSVVVKHKIGLNLVYIFNTQLIIGLFNSSPNFEYWKRTTSQIRRQIWTESARSSTL
jgi:hypothetical protein